MPDAVLDQPVTTTTTDSLGWRAGLPDDMKANPDLVNYKTVGDFTKDALSWKGKVSELELKLGDSIPKLPDDATDEERGLYLDALGRPENASEYEFDGEDKNAPEWTGLWKNEFHKLGLTKTQAKQLSSAFNGQMQKMVEAHNNALRSEIASAETKLRSELGDKFDTNVELAKRFYQKHGDKEFDKVFADSPNKYDLIRFLVKVASLTGEDTSPTASRTVTGPDAKIGFNYSKSPAPPVKRF